MQEYSSLNNVTKNHCTPCAVRHLRRKPWNFCHFCKLAPDPQIAKVNEIIEFLGANKMLKRLVLGIFATIIIVAVVTIWRAANFEAPRITADPWPSADQAPDIDEDKLVADLAKAITFKTISNQSNEIDELEFTSFLKWYDQAFPHVSALPLKTFNKYGRVYKWEGTQPDLKPILVMGHYDVVPVVPGTEDQWQEPPYAGHISDGYIWGRGAMDMKGPTITLSNVIDRMIATGYQPERTVYLALHQDEEVGGTLGAVAMAKWMADEGINPILAVDEGGAIAAGIIPGVAQDVAMIGTGEKGYYSLQLTAPGKGGHSSMPPKKTAVGKLSAALVRLENSEFDGGLAGPVRDMYLALGDSVPSYQKYLFANLWLYQPVIEMVMGAEPSANATLRTTIAPTMLEASPKENVLAIEAKAIVNFRIHPHDSKQVVRDHVRKVIRDPEIKIDDTQTFGDEPSPFSDTSGPVWQLVSTTVASIYPEAIVVPSLTVGATDSRHYKAVSDNIYRLSPMRVTEELRGGIHGTNERIAVADLKPMAYLYWRLLDRATKADAFDQ